MKNRKLGLMVSSKRLPVSAHRMRGQAMVEYFVVTAFTVIILIQVTQDYPIPVVQQVVTAMKDAYAGYTYALSYATNLVVF
jgi:hypothetical protein